MDVTRPRDHLKSVVLVIALIAAGLASAENGNPYHQAGFGRIASDCLREWRNNASASSTLLMDGADE